MQPDRSSIAVTRVIDCRCHWRMGGACRRRVRRQQCRLVASPSSVLCPPTPARILRATAPPDELSTAAPTNRTAWLELVAALYVGGPPLNWNREADMHRPLVV